MELAKRFLFIIERDDDADVGPSLLVLLASVTLPLRLLVLLLRLARLPLLPLLRLALLLLLAWLLRGARLLCGLLRNRL
jgi:hypothetical protein